MTFVFDRGVCDGAEQRANSHFVAILSTQRIRAILGPRHLAIVSAQHCHICGGHEKQTALLDGLHGAIEKRRRRTVRVQIHDVKHLLVRHAHHPHILIMRNHL